ncbi:hypothetical protein V490_00489 [Pseudogymnoascus sp. VKM F-3557]|nr:hypothetical protein V490_00489 [Pseudogymnoascus sp. VKM F-3557]
MAMEEKQNKKDLEQVKRRNSHSNGKPKNWFRLLELPEELIAQILGELSRFDYLNFLTSGRSEAHRIYFQDRVEIALATEGGYVESSRDDAFNELSLLLNGWNATEYPDYEINHHMVCEINSFPRWWSNNWLAPNFISDGSTILLGSGFEEQSLVIYDIATSKCAAITPTKLRQIGWPIFRYQGLHCYKLEGTTLTRLELPKGTLSISNITINKEFVCGYFCTTAVGSRELLLYTRDFVLKGKIMIKDYITKLYIRDKTIIGLTDRNCSIEIWDIDETDESVQTSIKHIKSIPIRHKDEFRNERADLSLSHNVNTIISSNNYSFYSDAERIAQFKLGYPWTASGCVDRIASQYFAEVEVAYEPARILVTFQISNIRLLNVKRKIKIELPLELKEILGCQMFFSTIVLFFASGVARLRLKNHESLSRKVAYNSSGVLVSTRGTDYREDIPVDEEEYLGCTDFRYPVHRT